MLIKHHGLSDLEVRMSSRGHVQSRRTPISRNTILAHSSTENHSLRSTGLIKKGMPTVTNAQGKRIGMIDENMNL